MITALIGFAFVLGLAFIGVPLAFALILVGAGGFAYLRGLDPALSMLSQQVVDVSANYGLSVLPMFILMGLFVFRAKLSEDLYQCAHSWLGHRKGGLAHATVASCAVFGAVSGSSVATCATMSKVAIPPMLRLGYSPTVSSGAVASAGVLAALIPPSVPLIVYGLLTETDIRKLFIATIVPGLLLALLFILSLVVTVAIKPSLGPTAERVPVRERLRLMNGLWGLLVLFMIVLGGMYSGIFTVTECAAIGAIGALAIALARRRLSLDGFVECMVDTARTTAMIFVILFGALTFANFVSLTGMTFDLVMLIENMNLSVTGVLIAIAVIYLILGAIMESMGLLVLTAPIFLAVVANMGVDPVWFGIFVVILIELGMLSPPVGMNVFTVKAVCPEIPIRAIFVGTIPYVVATIVLVGLVIAFPHIITTPLQWFS